MSSSKRAAHVPSTGQDPNRWRIALESAGDGMWDWHLPSNSVIYSDRWKTMLGYEPDEIGNGFHEWQSRVHPDDLAGVLELVGSYLARRVPGYSVEFRMRCKDGSWKWILARGMVTSHDSGGNPVHVIGTHTDITAWRAAQQRESAILRMIVEGKKLEVVLEAIVLGAEASRPEMVCCLHRYEEGKKILHLMCGPSLPASFRKAVESMTVAPGKASFAHSVLAGERVVCRSIKDDPAWRPLREAARRAGLVSFWAEPIRDGDGRILGLLACYHRHPQVPAAADLAVVQASTHIAALALGHDEALQRLRDSEERYARALAGSSDGLWDWNILTDEVYLSPRWKQMLGYEPHELPDRRQDSFLTLLHPDDLPKVKAAREKHFKNDIPYQVEFRLRTKGGDYRWFLARGKARRDVKGRPVHMSGTISDIDDRKRAEEALRESERLHKTVLDQTSAIILVMDAKGRFTHVNNAFVNLLGYPEEAIIGRNPWDAGLMAPEDVARTQRRFENLLKGKGNPPMELQVRSNRGQVFHVEIRSTPLCRADGGVERIIITGTDITVRRQLEQEVIRVAEEEQATIGHNLHDGIGQTLTGIHSLTLQLENELQGEHKKSAARIGELLQEAVAEVRRMSHGLSPVSVRHRGLAGGLRLLAETISTDFRVKTTCEVDARVQIGDPEREANLYRIAQEAVNNALRHGNPRHIIISLKQLTASHAGLEVRDDGRGMKLNQNKGNGIGLRVMRYRSDLIDGELSIRSTPRRGVRVTCCFPCAIAVKPDRKPPRRRSKK